MGITHHPCDLTKREKYLLKTWKRKEPKSILSHFIEKTETTIKKILFSQP